MQIRHPTKPPACRRMPPEAPAAFELLRETRVELFVSLIAALTLIGLSIGWLLNG